MYSQRESALAPARTGALCVTDAVVRGWRGEAAVVNPLAGADEIVPADTLMIADCNRSEDGLAHELAEVGLDIRPIGDSVAARTAVMAIHEVRRVGMEL